MYSTRWAGSALEGKCSSRHQVKSPKRREDGGARLQTTKTTPPPGPLFCVSHSFLSFGVAVYALLLRRPLLLFCGQRDGRTDLEGEKRRKRYTIHCCRVQAEAEAGSSSRWLACLPASLARSRRRLCVRYGRKKEREKKRTGLEEADESRGEAINEISAWACCSTSASSKATHFHVFLGSINEVGRKWQ